MWEDVFQVYRRIGDYVDLMASDMRIEDACLFVKAYMQENYNDQETSIEIRRQPMDYGKKGEIDGTANICERIEGAF